MSQADNKKPYELKKVGKHWLIGTTGKRFQRLPVLASATEIVVSETFLIVDEDKIYEIEENEEGKIILQKVEDASINDGERTTGDVFESTDSVDGQKINVDSKTTETALQDVHLSEEETVQTKQLFAVKETTADKTNEKQRNSLETTAETITKDETTTNKEFEIGNTDGSENYDSLDAGNTEETSLIFVEHLTDSSEAIIGMPENICMFQPLEVMEDVDENVWEVVSCSDEFRQLQAKLKTGQIKKPVAKGRRQRKTDDVTEKDAPCLYRPRENVAKPHHGKQETDTFDWKTLTEHVWTYCTAEGIKILVYRGNILNLPVDCIVNAANESLVHGGGIAAVIEKAAGHSLKEEGNRHIRKYDSVPVGTTFTSTAGKLKYNCVIHAVGPRWSDYSPFTLEKVQECEQHLYYAIYSSFLAAEKKYLKSIALPPISAAIFGVPEEICVYQYAKATEDYSRRSCNQKHALKEIHFLDKNHNFVQKIQATFQQWFTEGKKPYYDSELFVKYSSSQISHSDISRCSGGTQSKHPRHRHRQAEHPTPSDETSATLSEPLSFFDAEFSSYAYLLCGQEEQRLVLSRGDIFRTKATTIVVPFDQNGGYGQLERTLVSKMPTYKTSEYTLRLSRGSSGKTLSDVFLTDGFDCGYQYILHAVYPASTSGKRSQERKPIVQKLYDSIFSYCAKDAKISTVVTGLFGTDMTRDDVKMCAEIFLQSYLHNCLQQQSTCGLRVHLVCREAMLYEIVKDILDKYVMGKRAISEHSMVYPNRDYTAEENSGEYEGLENCVICMDTVTEPKTLDCGHTFCTECIEQQFTFKEACPTCGKMYGIIKGDQPEGTMRTEYTNHFHCYGYEDCGQISITYNFCGGNQGPNHPTPGKRYKGFTRVAYLPNNEEGRKVQSMLEIAFDRKLVFTLGNSRTTGEEGVIIWNDIHHKTDPRPNRQFGYPDQSYLERVKDELAAKGITEKDIRKGKHFNKD